MKVRLLTLENSRDVVAVKVLANLWGENFWDFAEIQSSLKSGAQLFVAETGEMLCGLCLIKEIQEEAELYYIFTHPEFRKQSVARQMLNHLRDFLPNRGIGKLFLEVSEKNMSAIHLYKSVGMVEVSTRKNYYKDGSSAKIYLWDFHG